MTILQESPSGENIVCDKAARAQVLRAGIAALLVVLLISVGVRAQDLKAIIGQLGVDDCRAGAPTTTVFFRDDQTFDADLSGATRRGVKLVSVEVGTNIKLSEPGRLGRWTAETSRRGGNVSKRVATDEQAVNWLAVAPIAIALMEKVTAAAGPFIADASLYGGLYQYNLTFFTVRRGVGEQTAEYIKRLEFSCRPPG